MNHTVNEYHINQSTMALLSASHTDYSTIVIELHRQILVKKTPIQLIKTACLDGGSTYDGRRKAVAHLTGCMQKPPIPINPFFLHWTRYRKCSAVQSYGCKINPKFIKKA